MSYKMEKIDDADTRIVYSGDWTPDTTNNLNQFNGTVHLTSMVDASATFKFSGLSIAVYGTVDHFDTPVISEYSIDDEPPFQLRYQPEQRVYQYLFYQSKPLRQGDHTLVIKNKADTWLIIDYFIVTPHETPATTTVTTTDFTTVTMTATNHTSIGLPSPDPTVAAQSLIPNTTSSSDVTSTSSSSTTQSATTSTGAVEASTRSHHSVNLALVIGTTVGGTALLVLLLLVAFLVKRRRRQLKYKVQPLPPLVSGGSCIRKKLGLGQTSYRNEKSTKAFLVANKSYYPF
ncbi:hypothetical protein AMATHDRAFT_86001 [Amanita thiersii Skay4041]|uniref:Uncharacterized protein n=1 Tax=Amanita thiersii Skay4041 TaxID=703135 RepID=A0A2A9NGH5_9AGAR|nr:hypothetical protein AMATHDRAFT_86001 [Amanita thiersii Skay4041]